MRGQGSQRRKESAPSHPRLSHLEARGDTAAVPRSRGHGRRDWLGPHHRQLQTRCPQGRTVQRQGVRSLASCRRGLESDDRFARPPTADKGCEAERPQPAWSRTAPSPTRQRHGDLAAHPPTRTRKLVRPTPAHSGPCAPRTQTPPLGGPARPPRPPPLRAHRLEPASVKDCRAHAAGLVHWRPRAQRAPRSPRSLADGRPGSRPQVG